MVRPMKFMVMALLMVLAFAVVACGSDDDSSSGDSASTSASEGGKDPGERKIGVMPVNLQSEYLAKKAEQVKATVEPLGWEVVVADGAADPQKMEAGIQSLVSQNVDAIFTMSVGGEEIPQGFAAAERADIPIFGIVTDVTPDQIENFAGVFADSNTEMGRITGDYIGENLEEPVIGWDITQNYAGHAYVQGVQKGLAEHDREYADLRDTDLADLVNSMTKTAQALIQANKGPVTFVDLSDFGSPIFMPLFERAGRDDITLVTRFDNASTIKLMKENPTMLTVASEGYQHIFNVVDALLAHWVDDEPLPTEPDNKSVPGGAVKSGADIPEGAEEIYPFQPALDEKVAEWENTYDLNG